MSKGYRSPGMGASGAEVPRVDGDDRTERYDGLEVADGDHVLLESHPGWYVDNVAIAGLNGGL